MPVAPEHAVRTLSAYENPLGIGSVLRDGLNDFELHVDASQLTKLIDAARAVTGAVPRNLALAFPCFDTGSKRFCDHDGEDLFPGAFGSLTSGQVVGTLLHLASAALGTSYSVTEVKHVEERIGLLCFQLRSFLLIRS
jgi:hypothetical protein